MRKFFKIYSKRINNLSLIIISFSFIILLSFFKIQILANEQIKDKVNQIAYKTKNVHGNRGKILDRNGKQLSITINKYDFWVNTNNYFDRDAIIKLFSNTFNKSDTLYKNLLNKNSNYVKLEKNILYTNCKNILEKAKDLKGLNIEKNSKRFYPYNNLACQTIGYVNLNGVGISGIEGNLDLILSGDTTTIKLKKGAKGKFYKDFKYLDKSINGKDVTLTIDINLQNILQEELKNTVKSTNAISANGIIIDPNNGDILAMASIPDYNPNNYFDYNIENYRNRVIADSYEPGSTFKILPLIASINSNKNIENDKYYCENGVYKLTYKNQLRDHEPHDSLTIKDIFIHSSNIGISKIVNEIDYKEIYKLCRGLGFGSKTGLPFKDETKGKLRNINNWSKTSKTYISIGQEIGITNIQLALAYSALANGGYLVKPHIIKNISSNDSIIYNREIFPIRKVFEKDSSEKILKILKEVVDKGTAQNLHLDGYNIGGKTGTAQKFINGKYSDNNFISSFASIFPINNPKYVIIVSIDSPEYGKHWSNESAVPVSKNIINRIIIANQDENQTDNYLLQNKNKELKKDGNIITASIFKKEKNILVPDLRGKSLRNALAEANLAGIELEPIGLSGKIIWQSLKPGTKINNQYKCKVKLSL